MAKYTQDNRLLSVTTPLGKDVLLLEGYSGTEEISRLFRFELEMLAQSKTAVTFANVLGKAMTVTITLPDATTTYISGICAKLIEGEEAVAAQGEDTFIRYRAEIVPSFWLLTRTVRSRIFQRQSVSDILKAVITGFSVSWQLQGTYNPRDYVTQYRESDFAFASRLMEEEGIFYFFKHTSSGHQMIVADTPQAHQTVQTPSTVIFDELGGAAENELRIFSWEKRQELTSAQATLWDFCFEMPDKNLAANTTIKATATAGTVTHQLQVGGNAQFELYDFPGGYAGRVDGVAAGGGDQSSNLQGIFTDNARTVGIRIQQEAVRAVTIGAQSDCRHFVTGSKFTLSEHFNGNGTYLLVKIEHKGFMKGAYTTGGKVKLDYSNTFLCLTSDTPFRPERLTPRAVIQGTQTAVVVGPQGNEIYTDKYSRIKVQFYWDRIGTDDINSSCWIRVGTPWAGAQWGTIHIPRIGQEVIVAFLEGDPDQPIVVGSVYNAQQMPPYTLPANQTQSGIKSRSTLQGTSDNYNELRFEDKKGSEQIVFHAEKDFIREVENNDSLTVGSSNAADGSQTITIYNNRTETITNGNESITISKGNRTETISQGNESITISQGNRTETISQGNESITLGAGSRTTSIKQDDTLTIQGKQAITVTGNQTVTIQSGDQTIQVSSGQISTTAAKNITLTVGSNSAKIDTSSITLTVGGNSVKIDSSGITLTGSKITLSSASIAIG
jgi:type VI secretion system secreted protein VgrG